jgi:hypothetical protein
MAPNVSPVRTHEMTSKVPACRSSEDVPVDSCPGMAAGSASAHDVRATEKSTPGVGADRKFTHLAGSYCQIWCTRADQVATLLG